MKFKSKFIHFHSKNIHLKMSFGKWGPLCLSLNVLIQFFIKIWDFFCIRSYLLVTLKYDFTCYCLHSISNSSSRMSPFLNLLNEMPNGGWSKLAQWLWNAIFRHQRLMILILTWHLVITAGNRAVLAFEFHSFHVRYQVLILCVMLILKWRWLISAKGPALWCIHQIIERSWT